MDLKKYKVIIISPEDNENGLSDGQIHFLGSVNENYTHSDVLIKYGLEKYGKNSIFNILNNGYYLPVYPAFFLTEYEDNVVFLNISDNKVGKQGLLYLPSNLSDEQIESVNRLKHILKGFNIEINIDLKLDDGIVESVHSNLFCDGETDIISVEEKKHMK